MVGMSRSSAVACALTASLFALVGSLPVCLAQAARPPASAPSVSVKTGSTDIAAADLQEGGASADSAQPQSTASAGGPPQRGVAAVTSRVRNFSRLGPQRESWTTFELGTKYAKGVLGGLEQGATIGLGVQFTTADILHFVELRATAITSARLYRRFEGEAYIPKLIDEKTHADLWFDYLRRTKDNFFGIGPNIPNTSMTNYDIERRSYNASVYHDFTSRIAVGGYFSVANAGTFRGQRTSDIPIDDLFSGDPNTVPVTDWAPGLLTNTKILSYGGFAEYDLRNQASGLTKGAYFYGRIGSAQALKYDTVFSDYGWLEGEVDARGYIPIGSDKTSLAIRGYSELRGPRGNSQIPFYDLSFLGGRTHGRGFLDYRFRANNLVLGSAELRQTVWSQGEHRGLDLFGFGDGGQVWGDNRSQVDPTIVANQAFVSRNWVGGFGGGVQYRYSKSIAGRVELGHSNERNLIYFSITRGF